MCYYGTIDLKVMFIGFHLIFSCSCCTKWIMLEIVILVRVRFFPYGFKSLFQIWFFSCGSQFFSSIIIYRLTEMPYSLLLYLITLPLWVQITHFTKQNVSYQWVRGIHRSYHMFHYPVNICLDRIMKCSAESSVIAPAKRQLLVWLGCGLIPVSTIWYHFP